MKKLFFAITLCFLSVFFLAGCDEIGPNATMTPLESALVASPEASPTPVFISIPLQAKILMSDAQKKGKVAYITIDDGPSKNTPAILAVLKQKGVKATFFVLGRNAERNPNFLKEIAAEGHVIGNHSYSHVYSKIFASPDTLKAEIEHTNSVIKSILGSDYAVTLFRFPGGLKQNDASYVQVVYDLGMDYYAWSIDPQDSVGNTSSASQIVAKFKKQLKGQQHPVILLHDANNKDTTVKALGLIIDELKKQGYTFDVIRKVN